MQKKPQKRINIMQDRYNILLVEDDRGDAGLIKRALRDGSPRSTVQIATTIKELSAFKGKSFDIILTDLGLPDSAGPETVKSVQKQFRNTPIVVLTGLEDPHTEDQIVSRGAQDYLVKSDIQSGLLMRTIRHAMTRWDLEHRLEMSERKNRLILENAPCGIALLTPDLEIISCNTWGATLLNTTSAELVAGRQSLVTYLKNKTLPALDRNKERIKFDTVFLVHDKPIDISLTFTPAPKNGWILVFSDITDRVKLTRKLEELATTDPLTGLYNRRHFTERADEEITRQARSRDNLSLAILDVDHFKNINDKHGHSAGDTALKSLATIIQDTIRTTDISGRIGGEEFSILLPDTDTDGATEICERLRTSVEESLIDHEGTNISLTISIGISPIKIGERDWNSAFSRADQALYEAKNNGRNQVICHTTN